MTQLPDAGYGPILRMTFTFSADRPFVSGNMKNRLGLRAGRPMLFVSQAAKNQNQAFQSLAKAYVTKFGWQMPDFVRVDVTAINLDTDRDNATKPLLDALEGICYATDRRIKDGLITLMRDKGPPRIIVAIQALDGKAYGFPKPSKRKEPRA